MECRLFLFRLRSPLFFSSRSRHTRWPRDWSSDVCSSDLNAVDTSQIYEKQADIEAEIEKIMQEKGLELFLFVVTDILNNDSEVLAMGNAKGHVEQAFGERLDNNRALLKGIVSRKKQIVTKLTDEFTK